MKSVERFPDVLFFSRGRGKGHAVPDIAIAAELRRYCPDIRIQFASYAIGAEVLAAASEPLVDLEMPEANPFFETLVKSGRLMEELRPRLVVSHEELAVLPAAGILGLHTVFLSHWFPSGQDHFIESLRYATVILFMQRPGLFPEPPEVSGRVQYLGPFVRPLQYHPDDRERARRELGIDAREKLILVLPGSPPEAVTPTRDLILEACDLLPYPNKRIIWIAGKDSTEIARRTAGRADVTVLEADPLLDRLMVACDVAVTKGTYNIGCELAALGIRSVSLSHGRNFIDDLYARSSATNRALYVQETPSSALARHIEDVLQLGRAEPDLTTLSGGSAALFARQLAHAVAMATQAA
jgi:hypothetical protein